MPENEKNQGGCHTLKKRGIVLPSFSKAKCELLQPRPSGVLRGKETEEPCKQQVGSFDEALWRMTHIRAAIICSKPCDSIAEDDLALLVSIPAPCFFDQQAVHDKNSKGDIPGFPN